MLSDIRSHVELTVIRHVVEAATRGPHAQQVERTLRQHAQFKNVTVRFGVLDYVRYLFGLNTSGPSAPTFHVFPWRPPAGYDGQSLAVRSSFARTLNDADYVGPAFDAINDQLARCRRYTSPGSSLAGTSPVVLSALVCNTDANGNQGPAALSVTDIATTQIGLPYPHPSRELTASTVAGQSYVNGVSWGFDTRTFSMPPTSGMNYFRIVTGADTGVYRVARFDRANARLYLQCLDGTPFVATASAAVSGLFGPTRAWFNQAGIIANGTGVVAVDGLFDPGENRASYIFRLHHEKSGSPTPADASQTGNYWFTIRPFTQGAGTEAGADQRERDHNVWHTGRVGLHGANFGGACSAAFAGGCPGLWLDRTRQRLWWATTGGSIGWWLYKSPETFHEVASANGTPNDPISGITLTGGTPVSVDGGTDDTVYVAISGGANAGIVALRSDLTAQQWRTSSASLGATVRLKVDRSRARPGGANTVTTTGGTGTLVCSDGNFSQADVGRAITITGGADAGTYKISAYTNVTTVTVQTLAGAAVSFVGQAATGTWQIGDRIYLFWLDTTSTAGKMTYMESLAFGTVLTQTVTMTNGAQLTTPTRGGDLPAIGIDPVTSAVYWVSNDVATTINRYDAATRTVTQKALSTFTTPVGGTGTISTPTSVNHIAVNPNTSFREVWVSTNQGLIKWAATVTDLTTLLAASGNYQRYFGLDGAVYVNPSGYAHPVGATWSGHSNTRQVHFGIDGHVYAVVGDESSVSVEWVHYVRDTDLFTGWQDTNSTLMPSPSATQMAGVLFTPYGECVQLSPTTSDVTMRVATYEIAYQWVGGAWVPKDPVRGPLPDATSQPGLLCKPLHATLDPLLFGVRLKFTAQGGATPANNEFIGRMGVTGPARTDGATTNGANTFSGSGFTVADVGRYLRIESGANAGVYNVASYVNANQVTLRQVNNTAWTATATAGSLTYSVWDPGSFGAECTTFAAFNGFGRDNTQDITNIVADVYVAKTLLSLGTEPVKPACGIIGPAGSAGMSVFWEQWARTLNPNYSSGIPQGLALPGTPHVNGDQLVAGLVGVNAIGTLGRVNAQLEAVWSGRGANGSSPGFQLSVDFGCDVEVGTVILRGTSPADSPQILNTETAGTYGLIGALYAAPESSGAPAAASSVRVSGTGLTCSTGNFTPTTTGDFLGTVSATATDGVTVQGGNTIGSAAGRFTGREGQVVRLTSGSDLGYYRIVSVNGDGSVATCRPLAQGTLAFVASAAGLSFSIYANAVREDDILMVPSAAAGTHKLCVVRLLTPSSAQIRVSPAAALSNQAWEAVRPTWNLVKPLSHSTLAVAPDVGNNGTYVSTDGRDNGNTVGDWKAVFDLTDLATATRTGRYWKFSGIPRFTAGSGGASYNVNAIEFYDLAGKRLEWLPSNRVDTAESQPQFMAMHLLRIDWIQSADDAAGHVSGSNGLATIGGTYGEQITLAGGNRFLGYQVRSGSAGTIPGGDGTFNVGADPNFTAADAGRILRITSGANAGYYRVSVVPSATQVVVTTINGAAVTFATDAGPVTWALHEGINAGLTQYDFLYVNGTERAIVALSDDLKTITTDVHGFESVSGLTWEIRRRGTPSDATGTDASTSARILYSGNCYARQSGDVVQDYKGAVAYHALDVGTPATRADGTAVGGSAVFSGSSFIPDDVGRILTIAAGPNRGNYQIAGYTNATTITLKDPRTGSAVTLSADATPRTYRIIGERRLRFSRYVTALRQ